jgi:flagellar hook assembly protein FlgD
LHQNYPNPFNPSTQFTFDLPEPGNALLVVYDVLGRKVAELADGYYEPGYHTASWDGRSMSGTSVASGIYFIRLTVSNNAGEARFVRSMKLVVMK